MKMNYENKVKNNIIFDIKLLLFGIILMGSIVLILYLVLTPISHKVQEKCYDKIQSYEYIIIDGISIRTSRIQEFKNNGGTYYKSYIIILEDGTEIETDSFILTNKRNLNDN